MKTLATEQIKLNGWSRSEALIEIADVDKCSIREAEIRLEKAEKAKTARFIAARMRVWVRKQATEDARNTIKCNNLCFYSETLAEKYKTYKKVFWKIYRDAKL